AAGPPAAAPAPPPPPPTVVASTEEQNKTQPKPVPEKALKDAELDKLRQQAAADTASNVAYGAALTWNVTVSMSPIDARTSFGALAGSVGAGGGRGASNSPDRNSP